METQDKMGTTQNAAKISQSKTRTTQNAIKIPQNKIRTTVDDVLLEIDVLMRYTRVK